MEDGKQHLLDAALLDELACGVVPDNDQRVPVLLAISDNGPQMTSKGHRGVPGRRPHRPALRAARHAERPGVDRVVLRPPHRRVPRTWTPSPPPGDLQAKLDRLRAFYNGTRLHEGIGHSP